ncbi:ectoine/hydroxyectoine ABC transporter permease subunit EhuD [Pseudonocardia humida]|uniref:Ectoine/hydroxyectoine ABC transporter permease subunit EhuD n=1 Tax=Pseudonocardia humida TaxID=2800819 RepID=A0ABT0ZV89_9PSEU|nr:ectoine/hydroxyectoine ABC transporter permease subunit EhuD [Pseudonocardia humida]MCO1654662.1 ectoine/hydroxyectoine ABC transporter permease subunit EhuD [Pseudonocardia humida]
MTGGWDWAYAVEILPALWRGLQVTLLATLLGSLLAFGLGLVFAVVQRNRVAVLHRVVWAFVQFWRSTPLLVQAYVIYQVLPDVGITLGSLAAGVLALGLHYACYTSEVYRAGIEAVPPGQWEAAAALSLPRSRVWLAVVLPQAVPRVLPALGNYVISMFKEVPLLLAIGLVEVVTVARQLSAESFRPVEPLTLAGILFLLISYPASVVVRRLERRTGAR